MYTLEAGVVEDEGVHADEDGVVDGSEAGRCQRVDGVRRRTDWCVMSMLSGPLRTTRFPATPAILLSRDWAQVRVTCGRASGAASDGTCSCTKLGDAIERAVAGDGESEEDGVAKLSIASSLLHLFFPLFLHAHPTMDPVVFPEVPPHATPRSRHAPPSPALSSADPSDREHDSSDETNSHTHASEEPFVDPYPDFLWMTTEEPHRSRRIAILKAHPEVSPRRSQLHDCPWLIFIRQKQVRKLMGPTPATLPLVFAVLGLQLSLSLYLKSHHTLSLPVLLTAYVVGGTANQNIFLAIHEITHNLALKSIKANKCLAIIANLSIGIPYAMAFKGYHIEHHKFLGEDGIDTDLPSRFEALVLNNVAGKTFFATFQLLFYAIRPGFIRAQTFTRWHFYNLVGVIGFHLLWYHFFGIRPWLYLVLSSFFAGSLHPCAAHFIAEHYLMEGHLPVGENLLGDDLIKGLSQETTSYYGWLNILCYNVRLISPEISSVARLCLHITYTGRIP